MRNEKKIKVIINPIAGGSKTVGRIPHFRQELKYHFGKDVSYWLTGAPGDATRLGRQAAESGTSLIIVIGGDGTLQEVVNGLYKQKKLINSQCVLGIINCGTGQGFAQSLRIPLSLKEQMLLLKSESIELIDVGLISYVSARAQKKERLFINECQAGIGSEVVSRVGSKHKLLGGKLAFGLASLQSIIHHRTKTIDTWVDGEAFFSKKLTGLVIANGDRMGGGMKLTPKAKPNDGFLDILFMHRMNLYQKLVNFSRIYSGSHLSSNYFSLKRGRVIKMDSDERISVEADGELLGWLPAEITLLKEKLKIKANLPAS